MRIQVVVAHPPEVAAIYHSHWGGLVLLSLVARGVRRRGSGLEAVLQEADLFVTHRRTTVDLTVMIKLESWGSAIVM